MTPRRLAAKIRTLRTKAFITADFERALTKRGTPDTSTLRYASQKEHWLGWLSEYSGPGYYGRKRWNRSAEFAYNHIVCAPMVLWLGEAAGVPRETVARAKQAALAAGPYTAAQCATIRRIITWEMIQARLNNLSKRTRVR